MYPKAGARMISFRGEWIAWNEGLTITGLLARFKAVTSAILVDVNGNIIWNHEWDTFRVPDGAIVGVHQIIAGG
jgi:thiamine biosynthesis protein ThiS